LSAVVELKGLSFAYPGRPPALSGVSLAVEAGEFVAVAGPNGGGKTTLLRLVLGLEEPTSGEALLFGEPAHRCSRRRRLAYLPQRAQLAMRSPVTVRELVSAGRAPVERGWGPLSRAGREKVVWAVGQVGLAAEIERPVAALSGGQQQRAFLAKLLAAEPALLALDEPTAGVDADSQERLGELLASLNRDLGVTILYVSHEFGAVEEHVSRLVLVRGGIAFDGPARGLPYLWHDPSHRHFEAPS